jgi:hypothetical protein
MMQDFPLYGVYIDRNNNKYRNENNETLEKYPRDDRCFLPRLLQQR